MTKTYNQYAGRRLHRIEAISDGVFAIAMTLLVLDIRVPVSNAIHSESELFDTFCTLMPKLLSYFLSFMTLGIFWTGHTVQFNFIEKSDRNLNWLSLFFLMAVSVVPFTTGFLSEFIEFRFALGVYWFNIFILGVLVYFHWDYAVRKDYITAPEPEKQSVVKAVKSRIIIAQSLYAGAALLCFISTYLSIAIIILIQLNYALAIFVRKGTK